MTYEIVAPACGEHCENIRLYGEHKANCGWEADSIGTGNEFAAYDAAEAARQQLAQDLGWNNLRIRERGSRFPL